MPAQRRTAYAAALAAVALFTGSLPAQDSNILMPTDSIETLFRTQDFEVIDWAGARFEGDRTQRVVLQFED